MNVIENGMWIVLYNHAKRCFFFHSYCCMMYIYIYIHMKFLLFPWSWLSLAGCKMRKPTRVCVYINVITWSRRTDELRNLVTSTEVRRESACAVRIVRIAFRLDRCVCACNGRPCPLSTCPSIIIHKMTHEPASRYCRKPLHAFNGRCTKKPEDAG
jgi:hypothetical protein